MTPHVSLSHPKSDDMFRTCLHWTQVNKTPCFVSAQWADRFCSLLRRRVPLLHQHLPALIHIPVCVCVFQQFLSDNQPQLRPTKGTKAEKKWVEATRGKHWYGNICHSHTHILRPAAVWQQENTTLRIWFHFFVSPNLYHNTRLTPSLTVDQSATSVKPDPFTLCWVLLDFLMLWIIIRILSSVTVYCWSFCLCVTGYFSVLAQFFFYCLNLGKVLYQEHSGSGFAARLVLKVKSDILFEYLSLSPLSLFPE